MGDQTRLELFNEMFLLVLDQLVTNIPHAKDLNPVLIADEMGLAVTEDRRKMAGSFTGMGNEKGGFDPLRNGDSFFELYVATLDFMDAEGFLRRFPRNVPGRSAPPGKDAVITVKGIAVLNIPLPGQKTTVSQNIMSLAKSGGAELRSSIISETVGAIMGAAAKGFLNP